MPRTLIVYNADFVAHDVDTIALLAADDDLVNSTDLTDYNVVMLDADDPLPANLPVDTVAIDAACRCSTCNERRRMLNADAVNLDPDDPNWGPPIM